MRRLAVPMNAAAPALPALRDLWALTKPRVSLLVVATTLGGMGLAGWPQSQTVLLALLGTALAVGGANALNMYLEREIDGRMARTRNRPLPAGRMRPRAALVAGLLLGLAAIPVLALGVNGLTAGLAALSLASYVLAYTPMKQRSPAAILIGAVPGAIPPLMGWTAARGAIEIPGLILFAILFIWQVPHFLAITLYRREEYARAGFRTLVQEQGEAMARRQIVIYLACLLPVSLLLVPAGVASVLYAAVALLLGLGLLGWGVVGLRRHAGNRWARGLFVGTLVYLNVLCVLLLLGGGR